MITAPTENGARIHLYGDDVNRINPEAGQAVLEKRAAGFHYSDSYLIDELTRDNRDTGYTYALCAAQRRPRGQIWLLVAGLTGPATYGAAQWVHRMPSALDDYKPGQASEVFWHVVRAKATKMKERTRETYKVGEAEWVTDGE